MYQISNERFGSFITMLRKEKGLTQMELAEQLFVSDKTVSKWERGLSFPNVALLIPIAHVLDVSVTELLKGKHEDKGKQHVTREMDEVLRQSLHLHKRRWMIALFVCAFISLIEIGILYATEMQFTLARENVLLICGLMLLFAGWFCVFVKDVLPSYYDRDKVNFFAQGIFKIHMVGLSFNNSNWIPICTLMKVWTLALAILYPLACLVIGNNGNIELWRDFSSIFMSFVVVGMIASTYIVGKKYE